MTTTTTTTWFTADWHLGHARIIELCRRPFRDLGHMHDEMVERHNRRVAPGDTVYVLGDVVMGKFLENIELVRRFNGRLVLVPGNHDRVSPAYHHSGPPERRRAQVERFAAEYLRVFDEILWEDPVVELVPGFEAQLSHFPYEAEDERDQRYNELRPRDRGLPLVHGHVHNSWRVHPNRREFNAGVDVWDFEPVPAARVAECLGHA